MSQNKSHSLSVFINRQYQSIVRADGIYLYDKQGRRHIDATGGPILCNLGHGVTEMADAMAAQARNVAFVYRFDFTTPVLEECCAKICEKTQGAMDRVFTVSGGSEAVEIAVKLARKYQIESGNPSKFKVISRWMSYHGMTNGALALSGFPFRKADYVPNLASSYHIPPAYCYRCWFNQEPKTCILECAQALETEILCQGPQTVAAFIAEPVSGMSLCAAHPRPDYFKKIREICDRYGVLLILDEVMTGFGRTGKYFAYMHFDTPPDILALGKGISGGYFPMGAAAASAKVVDAIASKSGVFGAGHSWAGNPLGAAVALKAMEILDRDLLVERCAEMGEYFGRKLEVLRIHPSVGDVRGKGLMWGIEFVKDKETKEPLDPKLMFWAQLHQEAQRQGLVVECAAGCDRGQAGDMLMLGPPFIVKRSELDEIVATMDRVLSTMEHKFGFADFGGHS
jgi:adenosylmethionine-8-amino-7-oxononanoate aminotransferase